LLDKFHQVGRHCLWPSWFVAVIVEPRIFLIVEAYRNVNKKLSYCWETVQRESMPRIAEMDVEMPT